METGPSGCQKNLATFVHFCPTHQTNSPSRSAWWTLIDRPVQWFPDWSAVMSADVDLGVHGILVVFEKGPP